MSPPMSLSCSGAAVHAGRPTDYVTSGRRPLAQAVAAIDRNHETEMPAATVMTCPQTVQPLEQIDCGFIERPACPYPSDACQYFVGLSRPPQGVVDLGHPSPRTTNSARIRSTHSLRWRHASMSSTVHERRAPFGLCRGLGNARARTSASTSLGESPVRSHTWCSSSRGRAHTAPRTPAAVGASAPVTNRPHRAITGRRRSSRSVRT